MPDRVEDGQGVWRSAWRELPELERGQVSLAAFEGTRPLTPELRAVALGRARRDLRWAYRIVALLVVLMLARLVVGFFQDVAPWSWVPFLTPAFMMAVTVPRGRHAVRRLQAPSA